MSAFIALVLIGTVAGSDKRMANALSRIENSIDMLLDFQLIQEATIEAKQARIKALFKEIELTFASIDAYQAEIDYYKNIRNSSPAIVNFRAQLEHFDQRVPDQQQDEVLELE